MSNKQNDHYYETVREAQEEFGPLDSELAEIPKPVFDEPRKEMDIWEMERLIKKLPEAELKQLYSLVEDLLHGKYGARMHY